VIKIAHLFLPMVLILAGAARGQLMVEVVGNLGATRDASAPFTGFNTFAQQFTTGILNAGDEDQDGNVLHRFTVQLQPGYVFDPNGGDGGEFVPGETYFQWSLLSDSLGSPGGVLVGPGTFSVAEATANEFFYASLVSAGEFVLQSNTSYWLAIRYAYLGGGMPPAVPVLLPLTTSDVAGEVGTLGELKESGDGWNGMLGRMVMQVEVESVPEPGSAGLVALGLAGLTAMRRRRSC
jgi:MYXO-CTERM domain-containing protein